MAVATFLSIAKGSLVRTILGGGMLGEVFGGDTERIAAGVVVVVALTVDRIVAQRRTSRGVSRGGALASVPEPPTLDLRTSGVLIGIGVFACGALLGAAIAIASRGPGDR